MSQATTPAPAYAPGVQALLEAEKEANRQVQQARQYRVERLKEARTEAATEIESLKQRKHDETAAYEAHILQTLEAGVAEYARETEVRLAETRKVASQQRSQVVRLLVEAVTKCEPHLHRNAHPM